MEHNWLIVFTDSYQARVEAPDLWAAINHKELNASFGDIKAVVRLDSDTLEDVINTLNGIENGSIPTN